MKKFMKKSAMLAAISGFGLTMFLVAPTSAQESCVIGCVPPTGTPTGDNAFSIHAGGVGEFSGYGAAEYYAPEGYGVVEKDGSSGSVTELEIVGNMCGPDCASGVFSHQSYGYEEVRAQAGAASYQSGVPAWATNEGSASSGVRFHFGE